MKKCIPLFVPLLLLLFARSAFAASVDISSVAAPYAFMKPALYVLFSISAVLLLAFLIVSIIAIVNKHGNALILVVLCISTIVASVASYYCYEKYQTVQKQLLAIQEELEAAATAPTTEPTTAPTTAPTTEPTTEPTTVPPTTEPPTEPPTEPDPTYSAEALELSNPDNWGITWEIMELGTKVESFQREDPISLGKGSEYSALDGVITFRGDNYRSGPTFGTADIVSGSLSTQWTRGAGAHNGWSGCGWTGQPLIVRWDAETKAHMNLFDSKKEKEDFVEVIYATLDGYIYFFDLEDGSSSRNPIWMGMNFKGAGSLDPRGYPLMYVGSGDRVGDKSARMYIISLIDGKVLY